MKKSIDAFFEDPSQWQKEYKLLREIILNCGLEEEFKWGKPCYTFKGSNIVLIHGFKDFCALLFHKGALLEDSENMLIQQTKNVQAARQIRFTGTEEIEKHKDVVKAYAYEAIEVEKAGLEVEMKKTSDYDMPEELEKAFKENPNLKEAFKELTPGRQRGYLLHFSDAKQSKTRKRRIEKYTPKIFEGKGWNER
ncbi:MAG: YdeI/OmpD-associated family protein [Pricia sp.]